MTKRLAVLGMVLVALALSGCLWSVHPLYTEETVVFEPGLVGVWTTADGEKTAVVTAGEERSYEITECSCWSVEYDACAHITVLWQEGMEETFPEARPDVIFVGQVTEVKDIYKARFKVKEGFRGVRGSEAWVAWAPGSGAGNCAVPFRKGARYLVYASAAGNSGTFWTDQCMGTKGITAQQEREELKLLRRLKAGGEVFGVVIIGIPNRGGISVTLTGSGLTFRTTTDEHGAFKFVGLPKGVYKVAFSPPGEGWGPPRELTVELEDIRCTSIELYWFENGR